MDKIREAFEKVKEDISFLTNEIIKTKIEIEKLRQEFKKIREILEKKDKSRFAAHMLHIRRPLFHVQQSKKPEIAKFDHFRRSSSGNEGVASVSQSVSQSLVSQQIQKKFKKIQKKKEKTDILDIASELKEKFEKKLKKLTHQELKLFSDLYSLDENERIKIITYKVLAKKTGLTPGAVRDYISRIIAKGVPIVKRKINNRQIILSISRDLKNLIKFDSLLKILDEKNKNFEFEFNKEK